MKDKILVKNIIKLFICIILFFDRVVLVSPIIYIFNINIKKISSSTNLLLSFISNIILGIIIFLIYRKEIINEWKTFKNNKSNNIEISIKYWIYGLIGMVISNFIIIYLLNSNQALNEQGVQKMISEFPIVMLITAGIIGPIIEELVFRKCFKNVIKNKWIYILTSGIIFGYIHVADTNGLAQFLYIVPYSSLGIAFALTYYKTDTIFSSIFVHMLHNTLLTIISIVL